MKKTRKRLPENNCVEESSAKIQKDALPRRSIFPIIPEDIIVTRKYKMENKDLYQKDIEFIHEIIVNHFNFWNDMFRIKNLCEDHILYIASSSQQSSAVNIRAHRLSYTTIKIKQLMKRMLKKYDDWRLKDGCFIGSPAMNKCCAGHAHGWTAIDRVYVLESLIFLNTNYHTKKKMIDASKLTKEEVSSLIDKKHHVLIHTETPVHQWSARMIMLQMRLISQRWNNLRHVAMDIYFRNGMKKLLLQIKYRSFVLIGKGLSNKDLQTQKSIADEGVLSENFNGKIVCTPQTNCGMSSIVSKGSWLDNLILSCSKIITKLQSCMISLDQLCDIRSCITVDKFQERKFVTHNMSLVLMRMKKMMVEKASELIDSGQIQEQLAMSLCVSLVGIDIMSRKTDSFGAGDETEYNHFVKARNVAPTGMCLWLDSYLKHQDKKYIIDSELTHILKDMREIAIFHTFETISKKEGNNDMGFMRKFFIRLESVSDHSALVFEDMAQYTVPFILKVGANYVVCQASKQTTVFCKTAAEAVSVWAIFMDKFKKWKIGNINFGSIYRPIFYI
jgi:hypothetical protein